MVLIGGVKYACERCIRGHRVTTCNHTDQPLMMIKPKGRPSSQCKHCKELRKNKNSHPSGSCTCGKNKKATASGSINKCSCKTGETCSCHGNRKRRVDSKASLYKGEDSSSILSPRIGSSSSINVPSSTSLNWVPSQEGPLHTQQSNGSDVSNKVRQIGMDPLANAKPIGQSTRTRVGEVSVPINEYVPNNANGIGNVNDKLPDVFFQDIPLPFEPGHGLLDLFANNNNFTAVNPYYHENPTTEYQQHVQNQQQQNESRILSPGSNSTNSDSQNYQSQNNVRSPSDVSNQNINNSFFSSISNTNNNDTSSIHNSGSPDSKISNSNAFQRNDSLMSLSSIESSSQMSRVHGSSESLTSGNYHHYDNMIHKPPSQIFTFPNNNNNNNNNNITQQSYQNHGVSGNDVINNMNNNTTTNNDDVASIQSVEVLSLTPSFMDIPTDFKNEKGYFMNNHGNQSQHSYPQQSSNDSIKYHKFTPSIDSLQSSTSIPKHSDNQSTIPIIHSSLINNTTNIDLNSNEDQEMLTPREIKSPDPSTQPQGSLFNFNTKLTTGL